MRGGDTRLVDYTKLPNRSILMIDAKSFYASAHCALLGLDPFTTYLAVVGDPERNGSIVLAASIALKRDFGISNVSRYFELPRDPRIQVVKAQMSKYLETSLKLTRILSQFAPFDSILQYSVDEAWVDITGTEKLLGDKWTVARKMKQEIWEKTRIPVSIGIGQNMLMAKLCLDIGAKKTVEGIAEWRYEDLPEKLWPLPVKKMWGIGSRMERNLHRMGIRTVDHLAHFDVDVLKKKYGIMGVQLHQHCWGIDTSQVQPNYDLKHKSYGNGITLLRDYNKPSELKIVIHELCDEVARRARKDHMLGKTIHLAVGYSKNVFPGGFSHSISVDTPTNFEDEVYFVCLKLFDQYYQLGTEVRNVYVSLSNLCADDEMQLDLFSFKTREKKRNLAMTVDQIRERFGMTSILKASSLASGGIALERSMKIGGHYG
jgi:DNA polymerase V